MMFTISRAVLENVNQFSSSSRFEQLLGFRVAVKNRLFLHTFFFKRVIIRFLIHEHEKNEIFLSHGTLV